MKSTLSESVRVKEDKIIEEITRNFGRIMTRYRGLTFSYRVFHHLLAHILGQLYAFTIGKDKEDK